MNCPFLLSSNTDWVTSSADSIYSQLNSRSNMTVEKVRGQRLLWIVTGHRRWLKSHGLLKCQLDSWSVIRNLSKLLEKCVDTVSFCVNYIFVLLFALCVQHEKGKPGGRAPPPPSTEWKHILWCQTTLDLLLRSALWWCYSTTLLLRRATTFRNGYTQWISVEKTHRDEGNQEADVQGTWQDLFNGIHEVYLWK